MDKVARELVQIAKSLTSGENKLFVRVTSFDLDAVAKAKRAVKRFGGEILEDGVYFDVEGESKDYIWARFQTEKGAKRYLTLTKRLGMSSGYLEDSQIREYLR